MKTPARAVLILSCVFLGTIVALAQNIPTLEKDLLKEDPAALAKAARAEGDARRGAILFYQQYMACTKCHSSGQEDSPLGPNLAKIGKEATDAYVVESILNPSKEIKKGFETVKIITKNGKVVTGLVVSDLPNQIVVRDAADIDKVITIPKDQIEERSTAKQSAMPAGLVNQLTNRRQFLDLARYVLEVAEHGSTKALELKPDPSLVAARPLPEYEKDIDHAGMIKSLNRSNFKRGQAIYNLLCINCHGTKDKAGSLPTSLKFSEGKFKNGSDPFTMYQTLTRGFGMMAPQTWMVPQQKYDVIHYIREAYLKSHNPTQYAKIDPNYLDRLPQGKSRGPKGVIVRKWSNMDYGPNLNYTYEIPGGKLNFAYKGIATRLDTGPGGVAKGRHWMIFDHDTMRVAAAWSGQGFIDWNSIMMNGRHAIHTKIVGDIHYANPVGPGWANPADGSFKDPRLVGRDKRLYGPLPRKWAHYKGMYHYGNQVIVSYTVGLAKVLEMAGMKRVGETSFLTRTLNIGPRDKDMIMQVAHQPKNGAELHTETPGDWNLAIWGAPAGGNVLVAGISKSATGATWLLGESDNLRLKIPAGKEPLQFMLWAGSFDKAENAKQQAAGIAMTKEELDLAPLTHGGPPRWKAKITTRGVVGKSGGPFEIDVFSRPATNPWFCRVRFTGLDFLPDGKSALVSAWEGDVWRVTGLDKPDQGLQWQRIASGMFQPLGLKIVDKKIYVTCRDQLTILHDLNGDGETDYYESFNNDHQVTEHFHEFAMGLQADKEGNFYYAKSARHAKTALVPHHGTLLKVSKDGLKTEILAKGFRAANGVCINPDGTFFVTDQEGHWTPKNRINWIGKKDGFYGNMMAYHDVTDASNSAMEQPLVWITNRFDRSPSELLWVDSDAWGPLKGSLLNFSYGYGRVYVVPHEMVDGQIQGGLCPLPIRDFPTGVMRGRFHPGDGQLYVCGMFSWAGSRGQPGGFYRIRYTGKPVYLPIGLKASRRGMTITFSGELDPVTANHAESYAVRTWGLKRRSSYGSPHVNEKSSKIASAKLSSDRKSVFLAIPGIKPTWCMSIKYTLKTKSGKQFNGEIHNSVHKLRP